MALSARTARTLEASLDRVLAILDVSGRSADIAPETRAGARANALAVAQGDDAGDDGLAVARLVYAGELLSGIAVDLAADPAETGRLIDELERQVSIPRVALAREILGSGRLLELAVDTAIEVQLALLLTFLRAGAISLWTLGDGADPVHVSHAGDLEPNARPTLTSARTVLRGRRGTSVPDTMTLGLRIDAVRAPAAALVAHAVDPAAAGNGPLLAAAAPILSALLDRRALLARERSQESAVDAVERRLARLRFDLHDGPQQDVHLLAQDLRMFRDQLRPMIAADPDQHRALGRLDDLEAQLIALDGDLRRLLSSVQSPVLAPGSLPEVLARLTDAFAARTGIVARTTCDGPLEDLSDSQQIALLALIREALSNIRKHSEAGNVSIAIDSGTDGVTVEISDDGNGFDPEATLVRAARAGHLGLVGMHERVRMLGGHTEVASRPGGPTVISATLPPWSSQREP